MIERLRLTNFRSHVDTVLTLEPVNLLIGPVASGKSNTFKGLTLLQNSVHRSLIELFPPGLGEFQWVRSRWARETDPIGFEVDVVDLPSLASERARYTLRIANSPAGLYVLEETLQRQQGDAPWQWVFQRPARARLMGEYGEVDPYEPTILHRVWHEDARVIRAAPGVRLVKEVARALSSFGYFHLEASDLKALGDGQTWDRIGYTGSRLPDFIAWAKSGSGDTAVYDAILREMREVLPTLEAILVTQTQSERQGIAMSFAGQSGYIAAPDLSDGTMFTLGVLCVVHSPKRPSVLCIEEPETGLHPRRLRWLLDRLLGLAYPTEGQSPVQVMLSTHSPHLVDLFRDMPQSVRIFDQIDGRTRVTPLTEVQREKLHQDPESDEPIGQLWAAGLYEGL